MSNSISVNPFVFLCLFFLTTCFFTACKDSKLALDNVTMSKVNLQKNKNGMLLYSNDVLKKSSYEHIKGSIPRLKAMITGRFVQYNTNADTARKKYSTWLVNGGKDSVVLYQLPVGDPNKNGHWVYHYQVMTSLPDQPIYLAFSKMTEIDRDTILAVYYEVPDNFTATITEIINKPEAVFRDFAFNQLKLSSSGEKVYYERKTPLEYRGISSLNSTVSNNPEEEGGYDVDYYLVSHELYVFGKYFYNKEKKLLGRTQGEYLVKEAMVRSQYIQR